MFEYNYLLIDSSFIESNSNSSTIFRVKFRISKKKLDRVRASSFLIKLSSNLTLYRYDSIIPLVEVSANCLYKINQGVCKLT